jgi:hypothetical protein
MRRPSALPDRAVLDYRQQFRPQRLGHCVVEMASVALALLGVRLA